MKKSQFYKIAAIGLLVLNISMIAFFLLTRHHRPHLRRGERFREKAVEILKFDESQTNRFEEMAEEHHQKIMELKVRQNELLKPYLLGISEEGSSADPDAVPPEFLALEKSKVSLTYAHFLEVKSLLNADQKAYFPEFIKEALGVVLMNQNMRKPKGHKKRN